MGRDFCERTRTYGRKMFELLSRGSLVRSQHGSSTIFATRHASPARPRARVGLRDEGSATPARRLDGYRARHAVLVGSVRSHAIVFVTPEVRRAHALLRAAVSASRSVAPSTARHALLPPNSMHTSQRTPPTWRLV